MSRGTADNLAGCDIDIHEGDIRDPAAVEKALDSIDTVIHLAAYGSVVESVNEPTENFDINVKGTFMLLQRCVKANVRKVIFASTGGALIGNTEPPVNENSLPKPISPYGASKLCCEAYCNAFANSYGLQTVMLRFANVYGPYSAHKLGAATAFLKAIMSDAPIVIYGDGTASRDFLYVEDLCKGIKLAVEKDLPLATVLHLASGVETSVNELARIIIETSGKNDHEKKYMPVRSGEVIRNFANNDRAKMALGFSPQISLLDGMQKTWKWFRDQGDRVFDVKVSDS